MFRLSEETCADSKLRSIEIMGKKVSQASMKISKKEKNQLSSLIKVLRPKVYITDRSSFKRLVQELTGNGKTVPSPPPPSKPQTVLENVAAVTVEAHGEPVSSMETPIDASVDSIDFGDELVSFTEELNQPCNHGEPESSIYASHEASVDSLEFCNQLVSFTGEPNQPCNHGEPGSSMEIFFDASVDSFEFCNQLVSYIEEPKNQPYIHGEPESRMESVDSFEYCNQLLPFIEELNQPCNQLHFDDITSNHLSIYQHIDMLTGQDFESLILDIEQYPYSSSYSQIHKLEEVSI
ncbi:hypothetical protein SADUNF_Sadunf05G0149200 [Salix dunnii]|uniref:VQ domain-containing protein n=1 Tax=Salix dunnii TaxID=1413687 RepID=A0A835K244_9ROSI|nr:hypothetical protein SADUNF_Sadunf05G0149200 [Salix dunnii]